MVVCNKLNKYTNQNSELFDEIKFSRQSDNHLYYLCRNYSRNVANKSNVGQLAS